ncbi:MAG TPA: methyltransferase [Acetobacteraceae bacterium]|nr:methyltransferase [Acetobacteraceae bacterium]
MPGELNPAHIMQMAMGFFPSKILLSAVELDLFGALADGPLSKSELQQRLGLHVRAAADFLDALVALGVLAREGEGEPALYANTAETAAFLVPASQTYVGGMMKMASRRLFRHWANLTEALRTGEPQSEVKSAADASDPFTSLYADPAVLEEFISAMAGVQLANFAALAEKFDFAPFRTACDAGGASGALCIALARAHPHLRCISFDLPPVTAVAARRIAGAGLSDRIEARAGDFMRDELPHADIVLMGNILHDWGTATKQMLVGKAFAALPDGGVFIAIENIIDDSRRENALGLMMSLNMLIETPEGYDYTFAQFDGWARAAGFRRTEKMPLAGTASAAIAWK